MLTGTGKGNTLRLYRSGRCSDSGKWENCNSALAKPASSTKQAYRHGNETEMPKSLFYRKLRNRIAMTNRNFVFSGCLLCHILWAMIAAVGATAGTKDATLEGTVVYFTLTGEERTLGNVILTGRWVHEGTQRSRRYEVRVENDGTFVKPGVRTGVKHELSLEVRLFRPENLYQGRIEFDFPRDKKEFEVKLVAERAPVELVEFAVLVLAKAQKRALGDEKLVLRQFWNGQPSDFTVVRTNLEGLAICRIPHRVGATYRLELDRTSRYGPMRAYESDAFRPEELNGQYVWEVERKEKSLEVELRGSAPSAYAVLALTLQSRPDGWFEGARTEHSEEGTITSRWIEDDRGWTFEERRVAPQGKEHVKRRGTSKLEKHAHVKKDPSGKFKAAFYDLEPGVYIAMLDDSPGISLVGTRRVVVTDKHDQLQTAVLTLKESGGKATEAVEVRGEVVDGEGHPVGAGANVVIAGKGRYKSETNQHGTFSFARVPPGAYSVRVRKQGYAPYQGTFSIDGDARSLRIVVSKLPAVRGQVKEYGGKPVPGAQVYALHLRSGRVMHIGTGKDGKYEIVLKEGQGKYVFRVRAKPSGPAVFLSKEVEREAQIDFTLPQAVSVKGTIAASFELDLRGQRLTIAAIEGEDHWALDSAYAVVDEDSKFEVNLIPGVYELFLWHGERGPFDVGRVTVGIGKDVQEHVVKLGPETLKKTIDLEQLKQNWLRKKVPEKRLNWQIRALSIYVLAKHYRAN